MKVPEGLLVFLLVLFAVGLSASQESSKKKPRPLDEILRELSRDGVSADNEFESLVRYDKILYEAYKSVTAELPPQASNWGRLGMLFYERDRIFKQGGAAEAASQLRVAMQLAALNLKQRSTLRNDGISALDDEYEEYDDEEVDLGRERAKLEALESPESQMEQIGKWLEKSRQKQKVDSGVSEKEFMTHLREETFAWSLQYAILNSYLGLGERAIKFLDFAAQYATSTTDEDDEETKYRAANDHGILTFHRADVYLKNTNQPKEAGDLFAHFLDLDGCSKEAGEARVKLVQAQILAEEEKERAIHASHEGDDDKTARNEALSAFRAGRVLYWEDLASQWAFEVTEDPAYGVSRIAVQCHREREDALRRADSEDGGLRLVGQPTEQYLPSPSLVGSTGAGAVPPLSTMTRWALFSVHDHLAHRLLASNLEVSTDDGDGDGDGEMEMRAEDHRQQAWEYLEAAHLAERGLRLGASAPPVQKEAGADGEEDTEEDVTGNNGDELDEFFFDVDPSDSPGEISRKGREQLKEHLDKQREREREREREKEKEKGENKGKKSAGGGDKAKGEKKRRGWSLSTSVQKAQALKKIFTRGYWPPDHLGVGSNSTEVVFVVGFFRSGSTLLERMLSASPYFVGIGEHSPVAMELRALEVAMISNEKENEERAAKGQPKAAPMKAMRRTQEQVLMKLRARANGTMAYTGYQPTDGSKGYSRIPTGGETNDYSSRRIIDKMLLNYRSIGMIHLLFPKAPILHLVRDPMDTLLSCYKTRFVDDSSLYTLHPDTLAREFGLYMDIMRHFRSQLPPGRIIDVSYSALVTQPRATLAPVLRKIRQAEQADDRSSDSIDLAWHEGLVRHHRMSASRGGEDESEGGDDDSLGEQHSPVSRTASYLQVKKPLYSSAVGSWLRYKEYARAIREAYHTHVYGPLLEQAGSDEDMEEKTFPFGDRVNWAASADYDYAHLVETLEEEEWSADQAATEVGTVKRKRKTKKKKRRKTTDS